MGPGELLQIGETYVQAIPEFSSIELDQTIYPTKVSLFIPWPGFDLMNQDESITLSERKILTRKLLSGLLTVDWTCKHPFLKIVLF